MIKCRRAGIDMTRAEWFGAIPLKLRQRYWQETDWSKERYEVSAELAAALREHLQAYRLRSQPTTKDAVSPHSYWPSPLHMGDCAICGHGQNSPLHQ